MNIIKNDKAFKSLTLQILLVVFAAYILMPNYLPAVTYLCESEKINMTNCLDASWVMSLHWALQKGLIFGKDYVFTYGPLGFLATRTALGFNHLYFLFSDFFIIGNLAFITLYAFRKFSNIQTAILALVTIYTISGVGMYSDQLGFPLLLISIFWLNHFIKHSKSVSLIIPVIITTLLFYLKANLSFISLIIFYSYLFYSVFSDKNNKLFKILCGLLLPLFIVLLSFPLNTNLAGYVLGSLEIVDGYNDAMSLKAKEYSNYLILAVALIILFFSVFFIKNYKISENRKKIVLLLASSIFTFTLFKQSFVRADLHIAIFFIYFPAICALVIIFYENLSHIKIWIFGGICLVCLAVGLQLNSYPNFLDRLNYYKAIAYPNNIQERYNNNFDRFSLPSEVTTIIGSGTIDIIPWNINYLYFNHLNYDPRPVVQSYTAYTPYLIELNGQKYESETAPEFVIFSNLSIDGRYAFFDDQKVKISLLNHYSCLGLYKSQESDFLLFQKKPGKNAVSFSEPIEKSIKLDEDYLLEDVNKSYFIKIQADYSLLGKASRILYKPFQISIIFTLEDGSTRQYRAIAPILRSGVLINPLIENDEDFFNFIKGGSVTEAKKIKSFKISLDSPRAAVADMAAKTYKTDIKLLVSEFSINRAN